MRITKILLENIKGHEKFDADCDRNSYGFLGSNGSGKTTILRSLCLAITRITETDQTLANMLRVGATSGRIILHFRLEDKPGILDCKIQGRGKTLKRSLLWPVEDDTKPITNATDIDAWVVNNLACDRKSIMEAAFPAQGQLEQLLFGDRASREELLIKILNLSFCESRARVIDGKIQALSRQVTDVGPLIDQARTRRDSAKSELTASEAKLAGLTDHAEDIKTVERLIVLRDTLSRERANLSRLENERHQVMAELNASLRKFGCSSVDAFERHLDDAQRKAADLRELCEEVRKYDSAKQEYEEKKRELDKAEKYLRENETTYTESLEPALSFDFASRETSIKNTRRRHELSKSLSDVAEEISRVEKELSELVKPDLAALETHRKAVDSLNIEIHALRRQLEFQQCLAKGDKKVGDDNRCPDCGLKIDATTADSVKDPERMKQSVEALERLVGEKTKSRGEHERELEELQIASSQHERKKTSLETTLTDAKQRQTTLQTDWDALPEVPDNVNVVSLEQELESARKDYREAVYIRDKVLPEARATHHRWTEVVRTCEEALQNPPTTDRSREKLEAELERADATAREIGSEHRIITNRAAKAAATSENVTSKEKYIQAVTDELEQLKNTCRYGVLPLEGMEGVVLNLKNQQSERDAAAGEVRQMRRQLDKETEEVKRLTEESASNRSKLDLIAELKEVKAMLHRTGLPLTYAAYKFDQLLAMTGDFLNLMGARFEIAKDEDVPLAFRFRKFDDDVGYLPMFDMSGGERVRVSVGFFLAVQQALLPRLGFMTLDEPSTHVDAEGKEAMVDLLRGLNSTILGENRQLFLIDHDPMFREALEGFSDLNKLKEATV